VTVSNERTKTERYHTLGLLADGGMAEIHLARRVEDALPVALKRIKRPHDQDPDFVAMFEDEGRLWARLRHPNVVRLLEAGVDEEGHFIAMELVDGLDLGQVMARSHEEPLPLAFVLTVGAALLDALDYLHTLEDEDGASLGLVHRDVSPGNVLCSAEGAVKLTDFGVVHAPIKTHQTRVGDLKGKFAYMSPEQTRGEALTPRSDLFAVGVVLWEMLAGKPLFDRATDLDTAQAVRDAEIEPLAALRRDVDEALDACIRHLLQREPGGRPESADAAARQLRALGRSAGLVLGAAAVAEEVAGHLDEVGRAEERAAPLLRRRTRVAVDPSRADVGGGRGVRAALIGIGALVTLGAALALGLYDAGAGAAVTLLADAGAAEAGVGSTPPSTGDAALAVQPDARRAVDAAPPPALPDLQARSDAGAVDRKGTTPRPRTPRPGTGKKPGKPRNGGRNPGRGYGTLDLSSDPWAEVAIDGIAIGRNTPLRNYPVAAGRHRVTLHNPHFKITKTIVIEVAPGMRVRRVIDLTAR